MRYGNVLVLSLAAACALAGCGSIPLTGGGGSEAWVCTQCNVACSESGECPACKCELMKTSVSWACPRCGEPVRGTCPICGVRCVPAVRYYRCPTCGRTRPASAADLRTGKGPQCSNCERPMMLQIVPIRYWCPDCSVWSSRRIPCPRCGLQMSPM